MTATSRTVRIADLVRDARYQVRARADEGTIERYAACYVAGEPLPPITVALVNGAAVVVDGFHRLAALDSLKRTTVEADVIEATEREAYWLAARSNLRHGLPLKKREMRQVFRHYVKARQHLDGKRLKPYRGIERDLGGTVHFTTLRLWMQKDFPHIARKMGGHEDFKGTGGLMRDAEEPVAGSLHETAMVALNNALAACRGVADPGARKVLVEHCERVLEEMREGRAWNPDEEVAPDVGDF